MLSGKYSSRKMSLTLRQRKERAIFPDITCMDLTRRETAPEPLRPRPGYGLRLQAEAARPEVNSCQRPDMFLT